MNANSLRPAPSERNIDPSYLDYLGPDEPVLVLPIISTHFGLDAADIARAISEAFALSGGR